MSKLMASILDQPQHIVAKTIAKLEDKNGYPSHDVRHLADNIQRTRIKITELGLDANDTTSQELYHALLAKFQQDSQQFDAQNGITSPDFNRIAFKAVELASRSFELPQRWVLKSGAAKALLKEHEPKKCMKQLNYRSAASMLKRESSCELTFAAGLLESTSWRKNQTKLINKLDTTAFELRNISLGYLSEDRWGEFSQHNALRYNEETGFLGLINNGGPQMPLLSMVVLLADALKPQNVSRQVASLSPKVAWWSDMDELVFSLNSEHVSLNIKDVSTNKVNSHQYSERSLDNARRSFWQGLLGRYDNQLEIQEDMLAGLRDQVISFRAPINQPAFEYAEDI